MVSANTAARALHVHAASADDVPALVELIDGAYRGEGSRRGWTTEADLLGGRRTNLEEISSLITHSDSRLLVLREAESLLACVLLRREAAHAYIGMLAVRPDRQGAGLGLRLLEEAERVAATELGSKLSQMTVIAQRTSLIAWYERRGYRLTGETRPFPYDDPRCGIPKRSDLHFVVLEKLLNIAT